MTPGLGRMVDGAAERRETRFKVVGRGRGSVITPFRAHSLLSAEKKGPRGGKGPPRRH